MDLLQLQTVHPICPDKAPHHQHRGNALGDHSRDGDPCHTHFKHDHEKQVKKHIDNTGYGEKIQRPLRIPHCPQDRRAEIVDHKGWHSHKINPHIENRMGQHIVRRSHQAQHRLCQRDSHKDHDHAAQRGRKDGRVDCLVHFLFTFGTIIPGRHDIGSHGNPDKQIHQQIDQRAGGSHGRQGMSSCKTPHHDNIRRVEHQLQHTRKNERNRKPQNFPE